MINNGTPTLILGLGGIGGQIAGSIYQSLSEQDKKTVSVIAIDTNVNDLWRLNDKHYTPSVQLCDDLSNWEIIKNNPEVEEWFPDEPYLRLRHHKYNCGTGQIRAIARLEFVNAEKQGRLDIIKKEITRITSTSDESGVPNQIKVCIVGTIAGGTGSGLAVCLPFYIRHLLKEYATIKRCEMNGYFIGADQIQYYMPSTEFINRVRVNAYACLKELNAFYMQPLKSNHSNNIRLEFYDHTDSSIYNIPYNQIVLLDDYIGDVRFEEFVDHAKKMISNMTLNSQPTHLDLPDHFFFATRDALHSGMNRYCSAGMCQLVYPIETAQEYVTLSLVKKLIQEKWLLIDSEYQVLLKKALKLMVEDTLVKKPELKTSYVELFREESIGDNAKLGNLVQEAYFECDNEYIPRSANFIAYLDSAVESLLNSEELTRNEEVCKVNLQKMKCFSDAESHISDVWEGMCRYNQYAKYLIDTTPNEIADELISIFDDSTDIDEQMRNMSSISQLINGVHPVTARFLIYDIINRLEEKVRALKVAITDVDLSAYREEDFDNKAKGVQNPLEYLATLQDKTHPFLKMLGPLGKAFNTDEKSLTKLGEQLSEVSEAHILTVREFMVNSIKYHVSQIVLERLHKLADVYAVFFSAISEIVDENNKYIENLENIHFPFNQYGIYCSADAFRKMSSDFIVYQSQDISTESKKAISSQLFKAFFQSFAISDASVTRDEKERRYQEKVKTLKSVFQTTVMDEIRKDVIEHGAGIVNLSAREALIKELELNEQMLPDDAGYYEAVENSVKNTVSFAIKRAAPMLRTELHDSKTEHLLFILSPKCAELDAEFKPDDADTARFYLRDYSDTTVLINDEAPDTELTIIRICYNYTVEDILNYRLESENEKAYALETQKIGTERKYMDDPLVITPHLDKFWHEEGVIPALHGEQRRDNHFNCIKAFIYGIGYGTFQKCSDNNTGHDTWLLTYDGNTKSMIRKCGCGIDDSFYSLLDSLLFNRLIVTKVLACAQSSVRRFTDCIEINTVIDSPLISGLCGNGTNNSAINIFDVFLSIHAYMPEDEWNELFSCLLNLLWEFLNRMGCPLNYVDEYTHNAIKTIFASSLVGGKKDGEMTVRDRRLVQQYERILKINYESV